MSRRFSHPHRRCGRAKKLRKGHGNMSRTAPLQRVTMPERPERRGQVMRWPKSVSRWPGRTGVCRFATGLWENSSGPNTAMRRPRGARWGAESLVIIIQNPRDPCPASGTMIASSDKRRENRSRTCNQLPLRCGMWSNKYLSMGPYNLGMYVAQAFLQPRARVENTVD